MKITRWFVSLIALFGLVCSSPTPRTATTQSRSAQELAIGIPDLDLVIGFYAGNYNDRLPLHDDYIAKWILPAVQEKR